MTITDREVDIHEFPLNDMKPNSKLVIIGKPGSGKSTLIRDIIKAYRYMFPVAAVMSGTEENNHFYSQMFHDLYVESGYSEDLLERFERRQKMAMRMNPEGSKAMLIIDDCSDDPKFFNRPLMQRYYKNGRHWEMMFILALQYCKDIGASIRDATDYIFIFRNPNEETRKKIYMNYAGAVGSYKDFCDLMDQLVEDYQCLVIDNRNQSNNISESVFYYKARMHPEELKFGCTEYRQWAEQRHNPNYVPPI